MEGLKAMELLLKTGWKHHIQHEYLRPIARNIRSIKKQRREQH